MKRMLGIAGALALFAWTGLGLVAWSTVAQRVTLAVVEGERAAEASSELAAVADELSALHQDVRALAQGLGEGLQALRDELVQAQDEHAAAFELRVAAWRDEAGSRTTHPSSPSDELAGLLYGLERRLDALGAPAAAAPSAQPVPTPLEPQAAEPQAEVAQAEPGGPPPPAAAAAPARKKSFLAFQLPSDDFRFDERRRWSVLPSLSRVGFDAKSTLHDFSGVTSAVAGELEADLSKPGERPRARLTVQVAKLTTGNEARDEAMREHLAAADNPALEFELASFEPGAVDSKAQRAEGVARGRVTIRGVTREVTMPMKLSVDDARRLCVEGETTLDLEHYDVPVPNKLGLVSMEKVVKIWLSLRLRAEARTEG